MTLRRGALIGVIFFVTAALAAGCGGEGSGPAPQFSAQWDTGGASVGKLDHPEGVEVGARGKLLVADTWNDRILLASRDGTVSGAFGEYGGEPGKLQCPRSVTVDNDGNIYVVDTWNHRVQKFSPTGQFLLDLGGFGEPWGSDEADGKFSYPYGAAVDSEGNIYVSDFNNNRLQKFDAQGKFVMKWGTEGRQDGQVSHPAGLTIDKEDRLYLADLGNGRIQRFTTDGKFDGKIEDDSLSEPYDVAVDANGDVYAVDFGMHQVRKYSASGRLIWALGERGHDEGQFEMPLSVAVDGDGVVYVSDWGNNRIQSFTPAS